MGFGCVLGSFRVFMPCMVQQMLYIGNAWRGKTPRTWHFWNIKIPKPPYISSLKIIELIHFWKILGPSEEIYNLQSLWITLYLRITFLFFEQIWGWNLKSQLKNTVAEYAGHVNPHCSLFLSIPKEADQGGSVHSSLEDLASTEDEEAVEETKEAEGDQGEEDCVWQRVAPVSGVLWQVLFIHRFYPLVK